MDEEKEPVVHQYNPDGTTDTYYGDGSKSTTTPNGTVNIKPKDIER